MNNQKQNQYNYLSDRVSLLKKELIAQIKSDVNTLLSKNEGMNQVHIKNVCALSSMGDDFFVNLRRNEKDEDNNFTLRVERNSNSLVDEYEDILEEQDLESLLEIILQINGESQLSFCK